MRRVTILAVVTAVMFVVACKKKEETAKTPDKPKAAPDAGKPVTPPAAPDAAPAAPEGDTALLGKGQMQNCPTAVAGATTKVENSADGVTVTVTADDPKDAKTVEEIRARAKKIVESSKKGDAPEAKHTGMGEGGGQGGHCTVVLKDTTVEAKDVDGGSAFTVKATDPKNVEWLQKETATRAEKFKAAPPAPAPTAPAPTAPAPK